MCRGAPELRAHDAGEARPHPRPDREQRSQAGAASDGGSGDKERHPGTDQYRGARLGPSAPGEHRSKSAGEQWGRHTSRSESRIPIARISLLTVG